MMYVDEQRRQAGDGRKIPPDVCYVLCFGRVAFHYCVFYSCGKGFDWGFCIYVVVMGIQKGSRGI